ncbi:hypothetical protein HGRIS_011921 [Hohenbuehelia grisea]|uniref:Uncharacterized protein n=1 Tax=Hohenbuehelia grisea TaxID=104357 RepID=A0ABR3JXF6_9AGAR
MLETLPALSQGTPPLLLSAPSIAFPHSNHATVLVTPVALRPTSSYAFILPSGSPSRPSGLWTNTDCLEAFSVVGWSSRRVRMPPAASESESPANGKASVNKEDEEEEKQLFGFPPWSSWFHCP